MCIICNIRDDQITRLEICVAWSGQGGPIPTSVGCMSPFAGEISVDPRESPSTCLYLGLASDGPRHFHHPCDSQTFHSHSLLLISTFVDQKRAKCLCLQKTPIGYTQGHLIVVT